MKNKKVKLYINGKLFKNRYDMNENFGVDDQLVKTYLILKEIFLGPIKITISLKKEMEITKDFFSIAFDPPEK